MPILNHAGHAATFRLLLITIAPTLAALIPLAAPVAPRPQTNSRSPSFVVASLQAGSLQHAGFSQQAGSSQSGAGAVISGEASAKDVGLPLYPGSKRHKDKDDSSTAANLGLWGGGSGFKLVVLKMESADSADKVAGFYKKALAKYGPVLDCSRPAASANDQNKSDSNKSDSSKKLECGDDKPDSGGMLFKAGTKELQHIVGIQPSGGATLFQIVYLSAWGKDEKK
jgi:hypothetical protein